jgi:hypothetical protein
MGLQTQGFAVRAAPQFTPVNPSLVAFNPSVAADGMLQAFQLAKEYENVKAKKALQAELEATRIARIAQTNALANYDVARTGMDTRLMPQKESVESLKFGAQERLIPAETDFSLLGMKEKTRAMPALTDASISNAGFQVAQNAARLPHVQTAAEAEADAARATSATSKNTVALAPEALATGKAELGARKTNADISQQVGPEEAKLKLIQLADAIHNAKGDAAQARAIKDMDLFLKNSQVIENLSRAEFYQKGGSQGNKPTNYANQIAALELAKKRLEEESYTMPDGTSRKGLSNYRGETRDAKGNIKQTGTIGYLPDILTPNSKMAPVRQDPNAENALKRAAAYDAAITSLLPQVAAEVSGGDVPQHEPQGSQVTTQDQEAMAWAQDPANAKSPHLQGVLKKLRDKGLVK